MNIVALIRHGFAAAFYSQSLARTICINNKQVLHMTVSQTSRVFHRTYFSQRAAEEHKVSPGGGTSFDRSLLTVTTVSVACLFLVTHKLLCWHWRPGAGSDMSSHEDFPNTRTPECLLTSFSNLQRTVPNLGINLTKTWTGLAAICEYVSLYLILL